MGCGTLVMWNEVECELWAGMWSCVMWNEAECGMWDGMWSVVRCGMR